MATEPIIDLTKEDKVASVDDFEITWFDRITLFISHTIKYLTPIIVAAMFYEVFVRYVLVKPTMWANELSLWLAGIIYCFGGVYASRLRCHIRIVTLYDFVSRKTQRIFDLIGVIVLSLYAAAVIYGGWFDAKNSLMTWEKLGTVWDPPIPAVMKPLILITIFLMAIQSINNLIIDWSKDKEKAYDPAKDLK